VKPTTCSAIVLLALLPLGAEAHAHLVQATPANDSVLTHAPTTFLLQFNEPARLTALTLQKSNDPARKINGLAGASRAQWVIVAPPLAPGAYMLSFRVLSDDSHITSGSIRFEIREP
jgi:methionine-rich copper-binding protein CopC